ncbi:hypothetical protein RJ639_022681 [Escallonia herrerae]|uniref:Uncharacterized protein n=1 Tax=Escallonia herrerae TaxID=1293975 RepID=A0AA88V0M9_9ASTE|nr:hypothetical protein RJ639_022681 [Escallonia herrerae]
MAAKKCLRLRPGIGDALDMVSEDAVNAIDESNESDDIVHAIRKADDEGASRTCSLQVTMLISSFRPSLVTITESERYRVIAAGGAAQRRTQRREVQYVLDPNLPPLLEITDNDSDETKAARKKREEDELVCRGHILNALSDRLYDLFTSSKCPKEIWKALENKYNNEKQGADKFLTLKYFEFTMNDSESVLDQVHQLQILVSKLKDLKVEAYRLLDLESNVIVESRDVEFIEDKFKSDSDFSAPTISLEIDSNVGSSRENESVVPNNTTEPRRSQRARKEKILDPDFIDSQAIAFLVEGDRENILKEIPICEENKLVKKIGEVSHGSGSESGLGWTGLDCEGARAWL